MLLFGFLPAVVLAAGFKGYNNNLCNEPNAAHVPEIEPHRCYTTRSGLEMVAIIVSGLLDTNAKHGDRLLLYSDTNCQEWASTVKYSTYCLTPRYRSLRYIPADPEKMEEELEVSPP